MRKFLSIAILLISTSTTILRAQSAYVNTSRGIFQLKNVGISLEMIPLLNDCGTDKEILSLAIHKDTVYYNNWAGELKRFTIGVPGSCEILLSEGAAFNSMTIDKNGIVYMASEMLVKYDPYKKELTQLGTMPFFGIGDMFFYNEKLILAGWNPRNWTEHGLYEIVPDNLQQSSLFMHTPEFFGLLSYPVSCGIMKYFGLVSVSAYSSQLIELDLSAKQILGEPITVLGAIQDAASVAATDDKVQVKNVMLIPSSNCSQSNGSITITANSWNGPVTYTHLNTGTKQNTGDFKNLKPGSHSFQMINSLGCQSDTIIIIPENIPVAGCNEIFIPNAFSPNNDGRNDQFVVTMPPMFNNVSLQVFNRGGSKIFDGRGNNLSWNGVYRGAIQPVGVYVYILQYTEGSNTRHMKGTITLIQ